MTQDELNEMKRLAFRFYTECEAPSDDDWETLFKFLVDRDLPKLRAFVNHSE